MAQIIKSAQLDQIGLRPTVYRFEARPSLSAESRTAVRHRAARILVAARSRAARIRQAADQARHRASECGADQLVSDLKSAVAELRQQRESWRADWEMQLLPLALGMAEKIIRRELRGSKDISTEWIRESLELISGNGPLRLRLHPTDLGEQRAAVEQLIAQNGLAEEVEVVEDADVSPGGCLVDSAFGSIDQCLEAQLGRLAEELA